MKVVLLLTCIHAIFYFKLAESSAIKAPLDVISYEDISHEDRKELEYLHQKYGRPKRSGSGGGSGDILESLKVAIGQGIKNKIGELAKGSAAASARVSSSSSGHGYSYHHSPHPPESYDHKSLDFWSLKKSILNTLLQAVKAIKGGVIAVKGQLIKGSGYLTAATGKLIVAKGDAVTNLGKKIASSAVLVPYHGHSSSGHAEYGPPPESHYSGPSAPAEFYHGAPSAPAPEFHEPEHHYPYHDDEGPHKKPSGLLVLKKIQSSPHHHHHIAEESKIPSFKPIEPSGPSFGTILGKFLSASSSLDPHKPAPFGDTATGDIHPYHSDSHQYYEESDGKDHHEVVPGASGYVVNEEPPPEKHSDGSPFEKEPTYLNQNFDDYVGSSSKDNPKVVKANSVPQEVQKPSPEPSPTQDVVKNEFSYPLDVQNLGTSYIQTPNDFSNLPNIGDFPNGFPSSPQAMLLLQSPNGELPGLLPSSVENMYYPQSPSEIDLTKNYNPPNFDSSENFVNPPQFSNEVPNYYNPPLALNQQLPPPTVHAPHRPTRLTHHDSTRSSSKHRSKTTRPKQSSHKRQPSSTRTVTAKHKPKSTYDVVKSISYELGPNGPKRLT